MSHASSEIKIINHSKKGESITGLTSNGHFKVLTELIPGKNQLSLISENHKAELTLSYQPMTTDYKTRGVYFVEDKNDLRYETFFTDDSYNFRAKFDTALKLMQSYTADMMHEKGYGRKTFRLDLDENGKVKVYIIETPGANQWEYNLDALFKRLNKKLDLLPEGNYKNLALLGFSKKIKNSTAATHYTALGGGRLAIMGGATLYTWPDTIDQISERFTQQTDIDFDNYHADDNNRFSVFSTASQTIGSALHELGHCFGLPHCLEKTGIMMHGAHNFHRHYTYSEPPHKKSKSWVFFGNDERTCLSTVSTAYLNTIRWFQPDKKDWNETTIDAFLDEHNFDLVVRSDSGLSYASIEPVGEAKFFKEIRQGNPLHKEIRFTPGELKSRFKDYDLVLRACNNDGVERSFEVSRLLSPPCISSWHINPTLNMNFSKGSYPFKLDKNLLEHIKKQSSSSFMHSSHKDFVNLDEVKDMHPTYYKTIYALRTFKAKENMQLTIRYDFNCLGRIWLNGKLIASKTKPSLAKLDQHKVQTSIQKGENTLLVETGNENIVPGFFFRIHDKKDTPYIINQKNELVKDYRSLKAKKYYEGS